MNNNLSLQMFTVRDFLKTPKDIETSLTKLRNIGFRALEVSSLQALGNEEFAHMLKENGFTVSAYSADGRTIVEQPDKVLEAMEIFQTTYVMYGWPHVIPVDAGGYRCLAKTLEKAGAVFAKAGKGLAYHNHSVEFEKFDGQLGLEIIFGETAPSLLQAELDTYWVQHGGGNPVEWCQRLKGRLPLLHLKDYGIVNSEEAKMQVKFMEIGRGNLNWRSILQAAQASGCRWFVIEQDKCAGDPFDSVQMSFEYVTGLLRELGDTRSD